LSLNDQIRQIYNSIQPNIQNNKQVLSVNGQMLNNNYSNLMGERMKINDMMKHYNDINQNNNDLSLQTNSNSYNYYLWLTIAFVTIILTSMPSENNHLGGFF
jgi:hypothetical protein